MIPKADALFSEIVFAVTRMFFGDDGACFAPAQRLVANALNFFGVRVAIEKALKQPEPEPIKEVGHA